MSKCNFCGNLERMLQRGKEFEEKYNTEDTVFFDRYHVALTQDTYRRSRDGSEVHVGQYTMQRCNLRYCPECGKKLKGGADGVFRA